MPYFPRIELLLPLANSESLYITSFRLRMAWREKYRKDNKIRDWSGNGPIRDFREKFELPAMVKLSYNKYHVFINQ